MACWYSSQHTACCSRAWTTGKAAVAQVGYAFVQIQVTYSFCLTRAVCLTKRIYNGSSSRSCRAVMTGGHSWGGQSAVTMPMITPIAVYLQLLAYHHSGIASKPKHTVVALLHTLQLVALPSGSLNCITKPVWSGTRLAVHVLLANLFNHEHTTESHMVWMLLPCCHAVVSCSWWSYYLGANPEA